MVRQFCVNQRERFGGDRSVAWCAYLETRLKVCTATSFILTAPRRAGQVSFANRNEIETGILYFLYIFQSVLEGEVRTWSALNKVGT
jgi:hypothetical protein